MASKVPGQQSAGIPSLLDRLTERSLEDASDATISRGELPESNLRSAILRDLGWLLNTSSAAKSSEMLRRPYARRSVLAFGVHFTTGKLLDNADLPMLESSIRRAIELFEPRLRTSSLAVQVVGAEDKGDPSKFRLQIEGEYIDHGTWMPLFVQASMDADTGRVDIDY